MEKTIEMKGVDLGSFFGPADTNLKFCLLYTSPSPRD